MTTTTVEAAPRTTVGTVTVTFRYELDETTDNGALYGEILASMDDEAREQALTSIAVAALDSVGLPAMNDRATYAWLVLDA